MAGQSRSSIDALRSRLDNLEEAETLVPSRPSLTSPRPRAHGDFEGEAAAASGRETGGRGWFSDDILDADRPRGDSSPHLRINTDLYTIESRTDDVKATRRWKERETAEASSSRQESRLEDDEPRPNRVSFADTRVPLSRRHHFQIGLHRIANNEKIAHVKDWATRQRERRRRLMNGRVTRLKTKAAELYKRWILEGLLRQYPLPPSRDGRRITLTPGLARRKGLTDERTGKPYVSNFIRSSRYTVWSFLPKQLFFQFSKLANFYFLVIGILQMIPGLSTTGTYTTIGPLLAFVALSMGKEGWDDYRRYKLDKIENRTDVWVLDPARSRLGSKEKKKGTLREKLRRSRENVGDEVGMQELKTAPERSIETPSWSQHQEPCWSKVQWQDLRVGDMVRLGRDENVPADIILLHATGPNGVAFIETMALDGETNLKSKQACPLFLDNCGSLSALSSCNAEVVSEDPNLDLYNYEGKAIVNGKAMPLAMHQVVYRGSTLRNTDEAIGVVIFSGEECKIRMNSTRNVHAKAPAMQDIVNRIVLLLVAFVILLSVGCSIGNIIWKRNVEATAWYLGEGSVSFGQILIGFVIAFNTLIPLSLYVSLEIVKIGQVMLLRDVDMYDPISDTPMSANTTTILENLGQVSYIFSDKTGTLTENLMRFRKMSVAGTALLHDMDIRRDADEKQRIMIKRQATGTKSSKGKGKQPEQSRDASLMEWQHFSKGVPDVSDPWWKSTVRPGHAQPELKTDDLIQYIRHRPNTPFSKKTRHFILCIALCHTCLPERKVNGKIDFQAASPDELALVVAAQDLGFLLVDRPAQSIKLQFVDVDGSTVVERYEVLDVVEFSSKRKRMSIIIRMPDNKICIFSKGADSVILPRLKLSKQAIEAASAVERKATMRKSMEQEKALQRLSMQSATRISTSLARSCVATDRAGRLGKGNGKGNGKRSASIKRSSLVMDRVDNWLTDREAHELSQRVNNKEVYQTPRRSMARGRSIELLASPTGYAADDMYDGMVDESLAISDSAVFERCFQHIHDFASEGLRTLLFAYRYLDDDDYSRWKELYHEATTSLVDRQGRIEVAAELIEQNFDLAGATAIEDKLQQGVPETIDKLRRANIKVWMLTGDKRETAINIAHSARICKPFSEIYILDSTDEGLLQDKIAATLVDVGRGMLPHSVVVIDGQTLSVVECDESLKILFFDLVARVDSVICCRASPSQKATLVKCIRDSVPSSLTLAIGDGANDIAMIQSAHVGIGISGREGLQAARISDYSIAQFRFLQKLLFVHGRWNYIRTGKYILGTFWKEIVFYLVQAHYQKYNGYTGTSLYESASLAVFNTLFTSLPVILVGIFEQDLRAETLLACPELYTFGQKNKAFNYQKYIGWMIMAVLEAALTFYGIWGIFGHNLFTEDNTLYAIGTLAFTVAVVFINIKMQVLELHNKTLIPFLGLFISISGWFLWTLFLSAIYKRLPSPYAVRQAFTHIFGRRPGWWLTGIVTLAMVVVFELSVSAIRRIYWPQDQDLMQEVEKYAGVKHVMREHAAERGEAGVKGGVADNDEDEEEDSRQNIDGWRWDLRRPSQDNAARRRSRKISGNYYVAPPFAATPNERDNPLDTAGPRGGSTVGKQKKGKETVSVTEVDEDSTQ